MRLTGSDCAGIILEGSIVRNGSHLAGPGDRVFGLATGCLASSVVASGDAVAPVPRGVLHEEGGAAPTVCITVDLALTGPVAAHQGASGGCRVLLHAAAGEKALKSKHSNR